MKIAMIAIAALFIAAVPAHAEMVLVQTTGTVEFNQVTFGQFANVNAGDPVSVEFLLDSADYVNSSTYPTRGYVINHGSFLLTMGSVVVGLQDPFPAGTTPYFVLRDNDPAVDGFMVSTGVDWPTNLPLNEPGGLDPFFGYHFEVGYTGETLSSLDIMDAIGVYDYTGLTNYYFVIMDGWAEPIGLAFEQLSISSAVAVEPTTWGDIKSMYR